MTAPDRIRVRWGKSGDTQVSAHDGRFLKPDTEGEYILAALEPVAQPDFWVFVEFASTCPTLSAVQMRASKLLEKKSG